MDGRGVTRLPAISYGFYMRSFCKSLGDGSKFLPAVQNGASQGGRGPGTRRSVVAFMNRRWVLPWAY